MKVYMQLAKSDDTRTVKEIIDSFEEYIIGITNDRFGFRQRKQDKGDSFDDFLAISEFC